MSLRIIKQGILDTIQDGGRKGYQHLGINPTGAMDRFSAAVANALLGKDFLSPVLEMHFPAPQVYFNKGALICLAGANFSPSVNGVPVPLHHPIAVSKNAILKFEKAQDGARCYMALWQNLSIPKWLGSYSTHLKAAAGGWQGRNLLKGDVIPFEKEVDLGPLLKQRDFVVLPWKSQEVVANRNEIHFLIGSEWHWMTREAQENFQNAWFQITVEADRMGYKLAGTELETKTDEQLVSSAVSFGTVQLLPNGQLIILMADHQTTGGYPRVAQVISGHLPILAQKKANDVLQFVLTDLTTAGEKTRAQQKYLHDLRMASKFRMEEFLPPGVRQ